MTLRRDLKELEARGMLRRVHGGAVPANRDVDYSLRLERDHAQKQAIGAAAARLIRSGQTIYVDAGTTGLALARSIREGLPQVTHLRIVSHGITVATELAGRTPYDVELIGGDVYQNALSTVGPAAIAQIAGLRVDLFFMGAGGVDAKGGWTNSNQPEAAIKRAIIGRSKCVYAIVGSAKWRERSFVPIVPFGAIDHWIVDRDLPPDGVRAAKRAGVAIHAADALRVGV
jgi:DeoR/GlpR family transcriptional regulator of sugar metabolism